MLSQWLRDKTRKSVEALAHQVGKTGLSPNALTVLGFLLNTLVAYVLAQGHFLAGGILFIFASLFDTVDGAVARTMGKTSPFGAFLDSTLDRFSEAVVYLGILLYYLREGNRTAIILIYIAIIGSIMVSYTRARAEGLGVECRAGFFTRFERLALLSLGLITGYVLIVLALLAVFSNLTALQRMYIVWKALKR